MCIQETETNSTENIMFGQTRQDILMSISTVSCRQTEDDCAEQEVCSRVEVFNQHCIGGRDEFRPWFNSMLRNLLKEGLVELTRSTVQLTKDGLEECWE